jgi:hypothetical protein
VAVKARNPRCGNSATVEGNLRAAGARNRGCGVALNN